jgi:hypothetical protein
MRRRSGWLTALVTAGAVLAPRAASAQEVPPADPVFPLPLYHDRPERGGFFVAGGPPEMLRQTNPTQGQVTARGCEDFDGTIQTAVHQLMELPVWKALSGLLSGGAPAAGEVSGR